NVDVCESQLEVLTHRHQVAATEINPEADWSKLHAQLGRLRASVGQTWALSNGSAAPSDDLVSWGERLAVTLVAGALEALGGSALAWDRPIIATNDHALPLTLGTRMLAEEALAQAEGRLLVAPGFIAQMPDGRITTLGRGGSDYSATLLAAALHADACW